jgi:magnesium transporter
MPAEDDDRPRGGRMEERSTMARRLRRAPKKVGLSPGTIEYIGERLVEQIRITIFSYDESGVEEKSVATIDDCLPYRDSHRTTWINIDGLHDTAPLLRLGDHYRIHPLVLEDIVHVGQRPKLDDYDDYLYVVLPMLTCEGPADVVHVEQISLVVGPRYVLSFQERPGDIFDPVRERIRRGKGRIRRLGGDYLAYALTDAAVDHCFVVLEALEARIEVQERALAAGARPEALGGTHALRREILLLRHAVWPLREVVTGLQRGDNPIVTDETRIFLRDVHDHTIQITELIDSLRDMLSGMQELYLTALSSRLNEVIKVLTIISTIFAPATFLVGVYGMNFDFMPELHWKWGYFACWLVIVAVALFMLAFFHRKRWL